VSFEKRFSNGLELLLAYTGSKSLTNVDSFEGWLANTPAYQDVYHVENEKALSSEDVSRRLVISHVYELPVGKGKHFASQLPTVINEIVGGWQLGGVITLSTGMPLFVNVNPDDSGKQGQNENGEILRPNIVKTPTLTSGSRAQRVNEWFDVSAFAAPAPYTLGNAPRTLNIRSDGIKNYDMTLAKNFPIKGERVKLELRVDAFNAFNRPTMDLPNMTLGSPDFGTVGDVSQPPRHVQVGARIVW